MGRKVLIDIFTYDPAWAEESVAAPENAAVQGGRAIHPSIDAELAAGFCRASAPENGAGAGRGWLKGGISTLRAARALSGLIEKNGS